MTTHDAGRDESPFLNVLCTPEGETWRLYARPGWMPLYLRRCFDRYFEAHSVLLDFEDLERYMNKRCMAFEKRVNKFGDVELIARDDSALELAVWLSKAFASGFRQLSIDSFVLSRDG
jgi:hypothetical protein